MSRRTIALIIVAVISSSMGIFLQLFLNPTEFQSNKSYIQPQIEEWFDETLESRLDVTKRNEKECRETQAKLQKLIENNDSVYIWKKWFQITAKCNSYEERAKQLQKELEAQSERRNG